MKYDWIKTIPGFLDHFPPDLREAIELVGLDNYMILHERFCKTGIYFSEMPITNLKKTYAQLNKHIHYNEIARTLNVSTKSIYNWRDQEETKK